MKLTLCVTTYKRADFIGETLASIVPQLVEGVELVVLDGASPDNTAEVVRSYAERHPAIRYIREETNSGMDADFDKAVGHARGRHCWLFSDDDLIVPGGVQAVLDELADGDPDLLVVDSAVRDMHLDHVFEAQRMRIRGRHDYGPEERDRFLADAGDALSFIGGVVIRRSAWMARERTAYYGSLFIHVGVIFQPPPLEKVRVLAKPLIGIRMGNAMWNARSFEIWMFKWPNLIWGLEGYSDAAKAKVVPRNPWRLILRILLFRAYGSLGRTQYRTFLKDKASPLDKLLLQLILAAPGKAVHLLMMVLIAISRSRHGSVGYNLLIASPYSNSASRAIGRLIGLPMPPRRPAR